MLSLRPTPSEGAKGISLVFVETDNLPGFRRNKPLKKLGMKGQDTSELFFDGCRTPISFVLGEVEGQGFYQLMNQLPRERLIIAAVSVAAMEAALEQTVEYVKGTSSF